MSKMHPPLFREVLRDAWQLAWRHKILWSLGLFAAFLGTGGALEVLAKNLNLVFAPRPWFSGPGWIFNFKFDLISGLWAAALTLLISALAIFLIFVIVNAFGALIAATEESAAGKKADVGKNWRRASKKFWPLFFTIVFFKILIVLFGLLTTVPLWLVLSDQAGPWLLLFYPLLFLVGVLASLISSFLMIYQAAFILLEGARWMEAFINAGRLFVRHWLVNVEMAVIIFLINLFFGLILIFGLAILFVPAAALYLLASFLNLPPLGAVAVFSGLFLGFILLLWLTSLLSAFQISCWTLLFRRMNKGTAVSKLMRLYRRVFKYD